MKGLFFLCMLVTFSLALDEVYLNIDTNIRSPTPINPRFASYSLEYGGILGWAGTAPNLRPEFLQFMQNIKSFTGASPQFRIGGNSADRSWWNPKNLSYPSPKLDYNIEPGEIETIQQVCEKLDTVATLSVNFDNPTNASWAVEYMQAVQQLIGWDNIYAIEIGNEVDLFGYNGYRASGYNYSQYNSEFDYYVEEITPYIPDKFIQGATFCCETEFLENIPSYAASEKSILRTVSVHNYPLTACHPPAVTLYQLLEDRSTIKQTWPLLPYINATINQGLDFWIGEMNSVSCGGAPNVSNVFGAALWAADMLFNWARVGVKGVNFHGGPTGWYTSLELNSTTQLLEAKPIYYGQYLFAQAIKSNSLLLSHISTVQNTNELVKVWPVYDNTTEEIRVVVIHKDITTNVSANVTLNFAGNALSNSASMIEVTAPSPYSLYGIQIGGQTFDGSKTGAPVGNPVTIPVTGSNNVFSFTISPGTMALVTFVPAN